jgi:hypothetical protein
MAWEMQHFGSNIALLQDHSSLCICEIGLWVSGSNGAVRRAPALYVPFRGGTASANDCVLLPLPNRSPS